MEGVAQQITALLAGAQRGDAAATERLVPLLYDEMRRLARALMARERRAATLQPTALVHEAYLRLMGGGSATSGDGTPPWRRSSSCATSAA